MSAYHGTITVGKEHTRAYFVKCDFLTFGFELLLTIYFQSPESGTGMKFCRILCALRCIFYVVISWKIIMWDEIEKVYLSFGRNCMGWV